MSLRFPITPHGYQELEKKVSHLKAVERHNVIKAIAEARAHGDLSENAEYAAAKERQGLLEAQIADLEAKLVGAEIINPEEFSGTQVKFGAIVELLNEDVGSKHQYRIVGDFEADLTKNHISVSSPIAKALLGKGVGDSIEVETPSGFKCYEILSVNFKS